MTATKQKNPAETLIVVFNDFLFLSSSRLTSLISVARAVLFFLITHRCFFVWKPGDFISEIVALVDIWSLSVVALFFLSSETTIRSGFFFFQKKMFAKNPDRSNFTREEKCLTSLRSQYFSNKGKNLARELIVIRVVKRRYFKSIQDTIGTFTTVGRFPLIVDKKRFSVLRLNYFYSKANKLNKNFFSFFLIIRKEE